MKMNQKEKFEELRLLQELEVNGGAEVSVDGNGLVQIFDYFGKAAHDAFGCYKCGFHWF